MFITKQIHSGLKCWLYRVQLKFKSRIKDTSSRINLVWASTESCISFLFLPSGPEVVSESGSENSTVLTFSWH